MNAMSPSPVWTRRAKLLLAGGLFVALAGTGVLAQAQPGPWDGHRHAGPDRKSVV